MRSDGVTQKSPQQPTSEGRQAKPRALRQSCSNAKKHSQRYKRRPRQNHILENGRFLAHLQLLPPAGNSRSGRVSSPTVAPCSVVVTAVAAAFRLAAEQQQHWRRATSTRTARAALQRMKCERFRPACYILRAARGGQRIHVCSVTPLHCALKASHWHTKSRSIHQPKKSD